MTSPTFTEQQLQSTLDSTYRNKSPLRTLWSLFKGRRAQLILVVVFFVIKQSPVWVLPIITGRQHCTLIKFFAVPSRPIFRSRFRSNTRPPLMSERRKLSD